MESGTAGVYTTRVFAGFVKSSGISITLSHNEWLHLHNLIVLSDRKVFIITSYFFLLTKSSGLRHSFQCLRPLQNIQMLYC